MLPWLLRASALPPDALLFPWITDLEADFQVDHCYQHTHFPSGAPGGSSFWNVLLPGRDMAQHSSHSGLGFPLALWPPSPPARMVVLQGALRVRVWFVSVSPLDPELHLGFMLRTQPDT